MYQASYEDAHSRWWVVKNDAPLPHISVRGCIVKKILLTFLHRAVKNISKSF